jgi:WD40 repeat protein/serine/threonine protein kinase
MVPDLDAGPDVQHQLRAACADLEQRLSAGEVCRVEELLTAFPALAARAEAALELIYTEFVLREKLGQRPSFAELQSRFPQWRADLEELYQVHQFARAEEGATLGRATRAGDTHAGPDAGLDGAQDIDRCCGNYELLEEIGRGGMGVVYQARQSGLDRIVALKMILAGPHASAADLVRFRQEAAAVARLQHPNVVQVFEAGEDGGRPYFAMEYVDGPSLEKQLAGKPLPSREAAELVATLAEAMHHAHQAGIVHRDLKPANILLQEERSPSRKDAKKDQEEIEQDPMAGSSWRSSFAPLRLGESASFLPKITDFGLAKQLQSGSGPTQTGAVVGTPGYMAPEQAAGQTRTVGPAADVYALGAILYECLTGRPPFQGATVLDTLDQVRSEEPVSPRRLQPKVPRDLETICLKCLSKEPQRRYASALALAADLRHHLAGEPIRARPTPSWERALKWARRHPAVAALAGAIGTVSLLLLAVLVVSNWQLEQAYQRARKVELELIKTNNDLSKANDKLDKEKKETADALREKTEAVKERDQTIYFNHITLAQREWSLSNVTEAERFLEKCPLALRDNWEWHFLQRLCHNEALTIYAHRSPVSCFAPSPDGQRLATGSYDQALKVWDMRTGHELVPLHRELDGTVDSVVFSPDGQLLAAAINHSKPREEAGPGEVKLWDMRTRRELHCLRGHSKLVGSIAFSPDGKWLASASADQTLKLWDVATGKEMQTLRGKANGIHGVAIHPDGQRLAWGNGDGTVTCWDRSGNKEIQVLQGCVPEDKNLAFSPDGKWLASPGHGESIRLWDTTTWQSVVTLAGHTRPVQCLAFSRDSRRLASAGSDQAIRVWDLPAGRQVLHLRTRSRTADVTFSRDGVYVLSAGLDGTVQFWDSWNSQEQRVLLSKTNRVTGNVPDAVKGRTVLTGPGSISPEERKVQEAILALIPKRRQLRADVFSPDGKQFIAGIPSELQSDPKDVVIRDTKTRDVVLTLRGHKNDVPCVAFSPDGQTVAAGCTDGTVKVWDARTGAERLSFNTDNDYVYALAFSPDSQVLASAAKMQVTLWEARTGKKLLTWSGHEETILALAFSPDGQRLASASCDGSVKLWDPTTGQWVRTLTGHKDCVNRVVFLCGGQRLAGVSRFDLVKVWDPATGQEVLTLQDLAPSGWGR